MERRDYFNSLLRRKWTIIITVAVTMVAVVLGTNYKHRLRGLTTLRIAASAGGPQTIRIHI